MKFVMIFFAILLASGGIQQKDQNDKNIEIAFTYAKKGIYYALSSVPEDKSRLNRELIDNNKLFAKVKLSKEINGVKIESTGYYFSSEVTIKIYRSFDSLIKDGYLNQDDE
jgi:hypothetical protein